jgi:hypothetical protein
MNNRVLLLLAGAVILLTGCNHGAETNAPENVAANAAASSPKHPTYCFFKDADTKGWTATRDAAGNVTAKGKALVEDTRYTAALGTPEVSGSSASLWLTMGPNTGSYGAPANWWDVTASVPNSSGIDAVSIMCGTKTVATLKVAARR